eukprot:CAMPEP_0201116918 /NCGR_PEP_ID=MMETSP0850-20130426/1059_1 /ASSEMBLY_ACC=CAM_ASM_000622 /TAXON_ID=183588 /ORGANISM="Pseudo-nitzschia fraudulenta, Strain WWA7" /LENGTH=272 /DNA_ID=CAMNT_0047381127 /DNA_START=495 /DNA_END=1313 /DNA_ORIENTATION=+
MPSKTSEDYGLSTSFFPNQTGGGSATHSATASGGNETNPDDDADAHLPQMRGDASLRPNTGNSNQEAGDLFGSLQEITSFLRWTTITATCAAIVWEGFAFPLRLFGMALIHPAQFVLGGYLGFFCILLLGAEFNNEVLLDNFGFLYDPISRGIVLIMMGGMCLGILAAWWESLLGLVFLVVGVGYIHAYLKYPEYRRWRHHNEKMPSAWQEAQDYLVRTAKGGGVSSRVGGTFSAVPTAAWADPNSTAGVTTAAMGAIASETQSLLGGGGDA